MKYVSWRFAYCTEITHNGVKCLNAPASTLPVLRILPATVYSQYSYHRDFRFGWFPLAKSQRLNAVTGDLQPRGELHSTGQNVGDMTPHYSKLRPVAHVDLRTLQPPRLVEGP